MCISDFFCFLRKSESGYEGGFQSLLEAGPLWRPVLVPFIFPQSKFSQIQLDTISRSYFSNFPLEKKNVDKYWEPKGSFPRKICGSNMSFFQVFS